MKIGKQNKAVWYRIFISSVDIFTSKGAFKYYVIRFMTLIAPPPPYIDDVILEYKVGLSTDSM